MNVAMPNVLDWVLLAVLLVSTAVGLWRGLVYEVLSLLGWVVAFWVAWLWGGWLAAWLPWGSAGGMARLAAGYGLVFLGTLIAWTLLARLARAMISATPLTVLDRGLGAVFGLLRGLVLLLALTWLVQLSGLGPRWPAWQASHGAGWLMQAGQQVPALWRSLPLNSTPPARSS